VSQQFTAPAPADGHVAAQSLSEVQVAGQVPLLEPASGVPTVPESPDPVPDALALVEIDASLLLWLPAVLPFSPLLLAELPPPPASMPTPPESGP